MFPFRPVCLGLLILLAASTTVFSQEPFQDVTEKVGLGISNTAAAWGDYDNDGWTDLYVGSALWHNNGGVSFARVGDTPLVGEGGLWGDYDNDGWLDLYCWGNGKLFHNLEGKDFEDVSDILPPRPMTVCRGATWGDFDGDSFLDLYIGGYEIWETQAEYPDVIFHNEDGRAFKEVWRQPAPVKRARGITAADFDEDGDLDIYVSNYRLQPNILWLNDGRGVFQDVADPSGTAGDGDLGAWGHTIGSAFADLDNDGHLDIFVGNFSHAPDYQDRPKFLRNLGPEGGYRFEDRSARAGLAWQESFASPALGDVDNDGFVDLFFTTVYPADHGVLYRNNGDWTFANMTDQAGVATANTYQGAWADFDNDGDLDLVSGGRLFANPGSAGHWLKVRLVGAGGVNRAAIGAQVRIPIGGAVLTRQVLGITGEGNQNDLVVHFGLAAHSDDVELDIRWPDRSSQKLTTPVDRLITVPHAPRDDP